MSVLYECGRCGELRQGMRVPDEWSPETVAKWQALEERFLCDACTALVEAYAATALADLSFAEDAIVAYEDDQ